jgi:hypothetical protein
LLLLLLLLLWWWLLPAETATANKIQIRNPPSANKRAAGSHRPATAGKLI